MKRYRAKRHSKFYDVDGDKYMLIAKGGQVSFNPDDFEEVEEEKEIEPVDITNEAILLESERKTEGFAVKGAEFDVIENKLNEVIKALNTLQKQVKEIKEK